MMATFAWWCPHGHRPFQMLMGPGGQGMRWPLPQYRDGLAAGSLPPAARRCHTMMTRAEQCRNCLQARGRRFETSCAHQKYQVRTLIVTHLDGSKII